MLAEEKMATFECTNLIRVTLTSHTRLRDKLDKTCKGMALRAFAGVADGDHQKDCRVGRK